eukprot:gene5280-7156_t
MDRRRAALHGQDGRHLQGDAAAGPEDAGLQQQADHPHQGQDGGHGPRARRGGRLHTRRRVRRHPFIFLFLALTAPLTPLVSSRLRSDVDERVEEDGSVEEVYEEDFDVPVQKASPPATKKSADCDRYEPHYHQSPPPPAPAPAHSERGQVNAFKTAEFHNIYRALYKDCASLSKHIRVA